MFKRFYTLFQQDFTVAMRNYFQYIVILFSIIMIIFVNFIIPVELKTTPTELFYDGSDDNAFMKILLDQNIDEDRIYNSRKDLESAVRENDNSLGIIMEGNIDNPKFITLNQGGESEKVLNLLDATIEKLMFGGEDKFNYKVDYLRAKTKPIPFNKSMIPVIIVADAIMLGFLLIAVMVFQEKEEGSIKAYRVSPSGTSQYILSKTLVNVLLALLYSILVVLFTVGFGINYLAIFILIILASSLMTLIGLSVSVFFRSFQSFLFPGMLVMMLTGLPVISYLAPTFAPQWLTVIPSYPVIFGIRELLFPTGKSQFIINLNLILLAENCILFIVSYWAVKNKLMKEGK